MFEVALQKCWTANHKVPFPSRIQNHLGSGQFGTVSKGLWSVSRDSFLVAIKQVLPSAPSTERIKLLQEAAIMGQFSHPNIVKLYGLVTVNDPVGNQSGCHRTIIVISPSKCTKLSYFPSSNKNGSLTKLLLWSSGIGYRASVNGLIGSQSGSWGIFYMISPHPYCTKLPHSPVITSSYCRNGSL